MAEEAAHVAELRLRELTSEKAELCKRVRLLQRLRRVFRSKLRSAGIELLQSSNPCDPLRLSLAARFFLRLSRTDAAVSRSLLEARERLLTTPDLSLSPAAMRVASQQFCCSVHQQASAHAVAVAATAAAFVGRNRLFDKATDSVPTAVLNYLHDARWQDLPVRSLL